MPKQRMETGICNPPYFVSPFPNYVLETDNLEVTKHQSSLN